MAAILSFLETWGKVYSILRKALTTTGSNWVPMASLDFLPCCSDRYCRTVRRQRSLHHKHRLRPESWLQMVYLLRLLPDEVLRIVVVMMVFNYCYYISLTTGLTIPAPTCAWIMICSYSAGVSLPGLFWTKWSTQSCRHHVVNSPP